MKQWAGWNGFMHRLFGEEAKLARHTVFTLLVSGSGLVLGYALNLVLARWMTSEAYGTYIYAVAWMMVLGLLASVGLPHVVLRYLPTYEVEQRPAYERGLMRYVFSVAIGIGLLFAIALVALATWTDVLGTQVMVIHVVAVGIPVMAVGGLLMQAHQSQHHMGWAKVPLAIVRPLALVVLAALVLVWTGTLSAPWMLALLVGLLTAVYILSARVLWDRLPQATVPAYEPRRWWRMARPLFLSDVLATIATRVDVLLLGWLLHPEVVGPYAVSLRTAALVMLPLVAVNAVVGRQISAYAARNDRVGLQRHVRFVARWTWGLAIPLGMAVFAFADPILSLFGPSFTSAVWVLRIIAVGYLLDTLCGVVEQLLILTDHQSLYVGIVALGGGLNAVLSLLLIPRFGAEGGAVALAISLVATNVVAYIIVRRRLGINTLPF